MMFLLLVLVVVVVVVVYYFPLLTDVVFRQSWWSNTIFLRSKVLEDLRFTIISFKKRTKCSYCSSVTVSGRDDWQAFTKVWRKVPDLFLRHVDFHGDATIESLNSVWKVFPFFCSFKGELD